VMIATHAIKHPAILFQHSDQLTTVTFHCPTPTSFARQMASFIESRCSGQSHLSGLFQTLHVCI
jgi:hypothetical protein